MEHWGGRLMMFSLIGWRMIIHYNYMTILKLCPDAIKLLQGNLINKLDWSGRTAWADGEVWHDKSCTEFRYGWHWQLFPDAMTISILSIQAAKFDCVWMFPLDMWYKSQGGDKTWCGDSISERYALPHVTQYQRIKWAPWGIPFQERRVNSGG